MFSLEAQLHKKIFIFDESFNFFISFKFMISQDLFQVMITQSDSMFFACFADSINVLFLNFLCISLGMGWRWGRGWEEGRGRVGGAFFLHANLDFF